MNVDMNLHLKAAIQWINKEIKPIMLVALRLTCCQACGGINLSEEVGESSARHEEARTD